ncbi:MAG: TonB-dependent receptor plug domain-containing protein [Verrucomicrobiota bacterium]
MNLPRSFPTLAPVCAALLLAPLAFAQAPAVDPLELARYDANKNGRLDPEELAARDASRRSTAPATATSSSSEPPREEPVLLSPFEVVSQDRGYYASSTMSGTRLNSRVEDLASSISVVTKEQMSDFAMLDINDIFLYEAGTEGIGTYTEFSVDRNGSPVDNSLNPNTANRVRGVGAANLSFANFELSGRMPIDPLLIDAVEISRGPNSTVFGLGNASGTVNMQPATANISRNRSRVDMRFDSYGGYRSSLDLNRILIRDTLAVRGSAAFMHEGYERKPSGTNTKRLNGMVRYRPFKNTTITASQFYYHITGNRPNTTTPRDAITGWIKAGKPTWDPSVTAANAVKFDGVARSGAYTGTTLPPFFANANFRAQSTLFIDNDGSIGYWGPGRTTSTTTPNTPDQNFIIVNTVPDPIRATQPLFSSDPAVNDKALYDWTEVNLAAMNRLNETTYVTHLQVEQILLDTPRHMLAVQAGYFREAGKRDNRSLYGTAGSSGATGFLHLDVNEKMLDGSPNPFFMRPFVGFFNTKGIVRSPYERETYRAQLAYRLDLRREQNVLRWLGMHQLVGYGEYKENRSRTDTFRDVIQSAHSWYPMATGTASDFARPEIALNYYRYYVGDNQGYNADQAPHDFTPGIYPYR